MGVKQWMFQRLSNLIFILFGLWLLMALLNGQYSTLSELLNNGSTRLLLTIVLLFAGLNSLLAGWQIAGDYAHKINVSQGLCVGICAFTTLAYVVVGMSILY